MSYSIHVTDAKFRITAKELEKAVDKTGCEDFDQLEEKLADSGWVVTLDPKGNVSDIDYQQAKLSGEIHNVLPFLAPFVRAGSFIQMAGEDGKMGRWEFNGKRCHCTGFAAEEPGYAAYLKELRAGGSADSDEDEADEDEDEDEDEADEDDEDDEDEEDDEEAEEDASEPD